MSATVKKLIVAEVLEIEQFISLFIRQQALQVNLARRVEQIAKYICPHYCLGDVMRRRKSRSGTQRFRCRDCRTTFGATNNTPFFRLRDRHLLSKHLGLMGQHVPLWRLREDHGLGRSIPTLYRWRHRFLTALTGDPTQPLAGQIEALHTAELGGSVVLSPRKLVRRDDAAGLANAALARNKSRRCPRWIAPVRSGRRACPT